MVVVGMVTALVARERGGESKDELRVEPLQDGQERFEQAHCSMKRDEDHVNEKKKKL